MFLIRCLPQLRLNVNDMKLIATHIDKIEKQCFIYYYYILFIMKYFHLIVNLIKYFTIQQFYEMYLLLINKTFVILLLFKY